jgi:hypothetical protein
MQQDLTDIQQEYLDAQTRSFVLKALTTSASSPESYLSSLLKNGEKGSDVKQPKLDGTLLHTLHRLYFQLLLNVICLNVICLQSKEDRTFTTG